MLNDDFESVLGLCYLLCLPGQVLPRGTANGPLRSMPRVPQEQDQPLRKDLSLHGRRRASFDMTGADTSEYNNCFWETTWDRTREKEEKKSLIARAFARGSATNTSKRVVLSAGVCAARCLFVTGLTGLATPTEHCCQDTPASYNLVL